MLKEPIAITGFSSLSNLGSQPQEIWENYQQEKIFFSSLEGDFVGSLNAEAHQQVQALRYENKHYEKLDKTVLMAVLSGRRATQQAGWNTRDNFGINLGSSRGATALFEAYHKTFILTGATPTQSSPQTTLGNIATWVAQDLKARGPVISHSITCSTALHAILNGIAWITSGMTNKFLVGGSEAPLTPFTLAQMKAMKLYANHHHHSYPCRSLDFTKKQNTMVLGEGGGSICLERETNQAQLAKIIGIGYAVDSLEHAVSISAEADCFQASMKMAMEGLDKNSVDAIVMHAPGTMKGDLSETKAIQQVFGDQIPLCTSTKWKTGHTFGASGVLSIELALFMMEHQEFIPVPFQGESPYPVTLYRIMVNAVGFGGNAVSILLERSA
ncbi:beta-ketoacyl synthase N-terminal-like domain-containing protein [Gangjinia marincola]|uniref:beta-ketoacyl synthase N-terminal-like domain-containing protein n=1 Tax=Gangjinia marincola TaxID=578463 RepID=UPI0031E2D294